MIQDVHITGRYIVRTVPLNSTHASSTNRSDSTRKSTCVPRAVAHAVGFVTPRFQPWSCHRRGSLAVSPFGDCAGPQGPSCWRQTLDRSHIHTGASPFFANPTGRPSRKRKIGDDLLLAAPAFALRPSATVRGGPPLAGSNPPSALIASVERTAGSGEWARARCWMVGGTMRSRNLAIAPHGVTRAQYAVVATLVLT